MNISKSNTQVDVKKILSIQENTKLLPVSQLFSELNFKIHTSNVEGVELLLKKGVNPTGNIYYPGSLRNLKTYYLQYNSFTSINFSGNPQQAIQIINLLLSNKVNINKEDTRGYTALSSCVSHMIYNIKNYEQIRNIFIHLLLKGANPNNPNFYGSAMWFGIYYFMEELKKETPKYINRYKELIKFLLAFGGNPNMEVCKLGEIFLEKSFLKKYNHEYWESSDMNGLLNIKADRIINDGLSNRPISQTEILLIPLVKYYHTKSYKTVKAICECVKLVKDEIKNRDLEKTLIKSQGSIPYTNDIFQISFDTLKIIKNILLSYIPHYSNLMCLEYPQLTKELILYICSSFNLKLDQKKISDIINIPQSSYNERIINIYLFVYNILFQSLKEDFISFELNFSLLYYGEKFYNKISPLINYQKIKFTYPESLIFDAENHPVIPNTDDLKLSDKLFKVIYKEFVTHTVMKELKELSLQFSIGGLNETKIWEQFSPFLEIFSPPKNESFLIKDFKSYTMSYMNNLQSILSWNTLSPDSQDGQHYKYSSKSSSRKVNDNSYFINFKDYTWEERKEKIREKIEISGASIICLQETIGSTNLAINKTSLIKELTEMIPKKYDIINGVHQRGGNKNQSFIIGIGQHSGFKLLETITLKNNKGDNTTDNGIIYHLIHSDPSGKEKNEKLTIIHVHFGKPKAAKLSDDQLIFINYFQNHKDENIMMLGDFNSTKDYILSLNLQGKIIDNIQTNIDTDFIIISERLHNSTCRQSLIINTGTDQESMFNKTKKIISDHNPVLGCFFI